MRPKDRDCPSYRPSELAVKNAGKIRAKLMSGEPLLAVVIGAKKSGLAAGKLLKAKGAKLVFLDDNPSDRLRDSLTKHFGVCRLGPIQRATLKNAELVVLSPGVPPQHDELQEAMSRGIVFGELEVASWFVDCPTMGITGTNGKSTTVSLIAHSHERAGLKVFAGGNLGRPLSELALGGEDVRLAILELSSYQLESVVRARFDVGCWLNLAPDHLERYRSLDNYARAKNRLVECLTEGGMAVLNREDPFCVAAAAPLSNVRWFSGRQGAGSFGGDGTFRHNNSGLVGRDKKAGDIQLVRKSAGSLDEHYSIGSPALLGDHNAENAAAAIECCRALGLGPNIIQEGLNSFGGLAHRLELVSDEGGIRWFNDSKATNIESALVALRAVLGPKILIAGGKDKGAPWSPLVARAKTEVKRVLAIGSSGARIAKLFEEAGLPAKDCGDLESAVASARQMAVPGDSVLFSPACASFDQFRDFEARGDRFRDLVLASSRGSFDSEAES